MKKLILLAVGLFLFSSNSSHQTQETKPTMYVIFTSSILDEEKDEYDKPWGIDHGYPDEDYWEHSFLLYIDDSMHWMVYSFYTDLAENNTTIRKMTVSQFNELQKNEYVYDYDIKAKDFNYKELEDFALRTLCDYRVFFIDRREIKDDIVTAYEAYHTPDKEM